MDKEIVDIILDCDYSFDTCPNPKIGCLRCRAKTLVEQGYHKVVKCKDCMHRWTTNCALYQGTCEVGDDMKVFFNGACHDDDFYCAYGEKEPCE